MWETTFNCRIITPLSLRGAKSSQMELRPPSLKGAMRFWWRAVRVDLRLEELKKQEADIFGSSDEKIGKSKFNLRMVIPDGDRLRANRKESIPVGSKSLNMPVFNAEQDINIIISSHGTEDKQKYYEKILLITLILGGLGKRSRRGMGSIKATKYNDVICPAETDLDYIVELLNGITPNSYAIKNNDNFSVIKATNSEGERRPFIKEIQIGRPYKHYRELLKTIAVSASKNDCLFTGFVELKKEGHIKKATGHSRLASPVYVSVLKDENGYRPIITTLNCAFGKDIPKLKEQNTQNKKITDKSIQFKEAIL